MKPFIRIIKFILVLCVVAGLTYVANLVAGAILLHLQKQSMAGTTVHTLYEYIYWYWSDPSTPKIKKHIKTSVALSFAICYVFPLFIILSIMANKKLALFGAARFATLEEIRKSILAIETKSPRILVGKFQNMFLGLPGELFANLAAGTRSGKGVSVVIPNLLSFPHTMIVKDDKFENFNITSKVREKHGQEVHLFAPLTEHKESSRYNAMGYIRMNEFRVADIIMIGEILYPSGKSKDPFWENSARNLFLANALYLTETPTKPLTLGEMMRLGSFNGLTPKAYFTELIAQRNNQIKQKFNLETGQLAEVKEPLDLKQWLALDPIKRNELPPLSEECTGAIYRFLSAPEQTMSSIVSTYLSPLLLWANPVVDAATSANDFDLSQVRKKRMSIYVGAPSEAALLINLFFSQLIKINLRSMPLDDSSIKYQCLLLLDEFTSLGTINIIDEANGYLASYWLRLLLIYQSLGQLEQDRPRGYGKTGARTLSTNCGLQIVHAPREEEDAKAYSTMLGTMTVINKTKGKSARTKGGGGGLSTNESDHKRELMLPQEVKAIGSDKQIIFCENIPPILCDKIRYYNEPIFMNKLKDVSPSLKALGDKLPSFDELKLAIQNNELRVQPRKLELAELHINLINKNNSDNDESEGLSHFNIFKSKYNNLFNQGGEIKMETINENGEWIGNDETESEASAALLLAECVEENETDSQIS